jgi:hypothetical protein
MAADDIDSDLDPGLARRLAALHPDVEDDGFTTSLMAALPARTTGHRPTATAGAPVAWPAAIAATLALAVLVLLFATGAEAPAEPGLLTRLDTASTTARDLGGLLEALPALFETHFYTLVAGAVCAATLLAPQLLED